MFDLIVIAMAGVATWTLRSSFIVLVGGRQLPASTDEVLRQARPAVLAALVATAVAGHGATFDAALGVRLLALVAATAVVWHTRNLMLGLAAGFAVLWPVLAFTSL
ncbi:MAG: AzlD domain-containing protein [Dehalococcoidia bacterium]